MAIDDNVFFEPGTDADFDRYAVQVQNGNYVSYHIDDDDYWERQEREIERMRDD